MIKPKLYKGGQLKGSWEVTVKLDGVRALWSDKGPVSRAGKPLFNLPDMPVGTDAEVFTGSWEETISSVRTKESSTVPVSCLYSLDPIDDRLVLGTWENPEEERIKTTLAMVVKDGYEGLVLRQGNKWLKVKTEETHDVPVTGVVEGTGQHTGRLGAIQTPMGKVGTGFTTAQRESLWSQDIVGKIIEVSCMELTSNGQFRHPRFIRLREDKSG